MKLKDKRTKAQSEKAIKRAIRKFGDRDGTLKKKLKEVEAK